MILETQQSSDTTYRVYDYNRRDDFGNLRELHIKKSMDVTTVPNNENKTSFTECLLEDTLIATYVESDFFTVYKWDVNGTTRFNYNEKYLLVSVLDGSGILIQNEDKFPFNKGSHFIIPVGFGEFEIDGKCSFMVSHM